MLKIWYLFQVDVEHYGTCYLHMGAEGCHGLHFLSPLVPYLRFLGCHDFC